MTPLEHAIEDALAPGDFIHKRTCPRFVRRLEDVLERFEHSDTNDSQEEALKFYEIFLVACYAKAEEIDDSSGDFGDFFIELIARWAKTAEQIGYSGTQITDKTLTWATKDEYGYLERSVDVAARAVKPETLAEFPNVLYPAWKQVCETPPPKEREGLFDFRAAIAASRLKHVYWLRKDSKAYLAFCEETELNDEDCERLAKMYSEVGRLEQALSWVERGIEKTTTRKHFHRKHIFQELKISLLNELGHIDEARELAWQLFAESPSESRYSDLMDLAPDDKREAWHEKAMGLARANPHEFLKLCAATSSWDKLHIMLEKGDEELTTVFYGTLLPVAQACASNHPHIAARLYVILAKQILERAKAKAYHHAWDYLAAAKQGYAACAKHEDWENVADEIRKAHFRKYKFMSGFQQILDGTYGKPDPSFLTQARKKWDHL